MKRLEKGFTLIELMIVVAIIAILAAVAAPKFGIQIKKAHDAKGLAVVGALRSAATMKVADSIGTSTIPTYGALKAELDTKSQTLVPQTTTSNAAITVGLNDGYGTAATGITLSSTLIQVDTPDSEGIIGISSINGNDAKGNSWDTY